MPAAAATNVLSQNGRRTYLSKMYCWRRPLALLCTSLAVTALISIFYGGIGYSDSGASVGSLGRTAVARGLRYDQDGNQGGIIQSIRYTRGKIDCGRSTHGRRYRSVMCTITRNDAHLREFLVRHLLLGFCHIVVYDNNKVSQGQDHNITDLLEPFVQGGLVTHIPFYQNHTGLLPEPLKNQHVSDCVERFGHDADWMASLDTDECIHISRKVDGKPSQSRPRSQADAGSQQPTSVGILSKFLSDVEQQRAVNSTCALSLPWRMAYGEHRILRDSRLLMEAYPRFCMTHKLAKLLFRPDAAILEPPHTAECSAKNVQDDSSRLAGLKPAWLSASGTARSQSDSQALSVDDEVFRSALPQYDVDLLHYYTRSMEEFVAKSEQSIPPWYRLVNTSYDIAQHCTLDPIPFDSEYVAAVHSSMTVLTSMQTTKAQQCAEGASKADTSTGASCESEIGGVADGGVVLSRPLESKPSSRPDYALYMFMKLRVQQQHEWDESLYLSRNPEVEHMIHQHRFVDGLHHFVVMGFQAGKESCWKTARDGTLCI